MTDRKAHVEQLVRLFERLSKDSDTISLVDSIAVGLCLRIKYSYPSETEVLHRGAFSKQSSFAIIETESTSQLPVFSPIDRPAVRNRKPTVSADEGRNLEVHEDMIRMAHEMKEVAGGVHSIIKRDTVELSNTYGLQESNIDATSQQNSSADSIRRRNRLSFLFTIFMIFSSLFIFMVLFFLIVVVT